MEYLKSCTKLNLRVDKVKFVVPYKENADKEPDKVPV